VGQVISLKSQNWAAPNNAMQPTANSVALMWEIWMVSRLRARRLMAGVRRHPLIIVESI
jgi:hypothetical protein